jgi:hypothetical protein
METRTQNSVLSILTLALFSASGCVGSEYFDSTVFDNELEMGIEDLQDGSLNFEESATLHAIANDGEDLERESPVGTLVDLTARQIHNQVRSMMRNDPCEPSGIVTGRYRADEDDSSQGEFHGRLTRSSGDVILDFVGDWTDSIAADGTGGFDGVFETYEGDEGVLEGMYYPRLESASGPLGTFESRLDMPSLSDEDTPDETIQVLRGVWHNMTNGDGLLVGYRAKCTMPDIADPAE